MFTKKRVLTILFLSLAIPVIAGAPEVLSVIIGGRALDGKALWYDGKIYVPLESVSKAMNGNYRYDAERGIASVELTGRGASPSTLADRPHLQVVSESAYSTGDNMKVLATVINKGLAPARELEITCTFRSGSRSELIASVAQLPELKPGERKTLEFWLFEQRLPDASGGRPYAQPMAVPGAYLGRGQKYVFIGTDWERVTYDLNFNYLNPDNTYSSKPG